MSWDEKLFGYFLKKLGGRDKAREQALLTRVKLEDVSSRLRFLACALTGDPLELSEAESVGGYRGQRLLLPAEILSYPSYDLNFKAYLYRLIYSVATYEMNLKLPSGEENAARARAFSALAIPSVRTYLEAELPESRALLAELGRSLPAKVRSVDLRRESWLLYLHLALDWPVPPDADLQQLDWAKSLLELAKTTRNTESIDHPMLKNPDSLMTPEAEELFTLIGGLMHDARHSLSDSRETEGLSVDSLSTGTQKKGKAREEVEEVKLGENKDDEAPLVHVLEKVFTAEEYKGGKKTLDGDDEIEDHEEALDELNLKHVIRSRDRANSIYKSDVFVDGGAPDLEGDDPVSATSFSYDEWDHKTRSYRRNWCNVYAQTPRSIHDLEEFKDLITLPRSHKKTVQRLRSELEKLMNERRWKSRQIDGAELDLDALVDHTVALKCRHIPSNRIYLSRRRSQRDLAATVLIDMSLSTDSWVDNMHVIQVARESVLVLSEVLEGIATEVSVAGFYSNTRRDCRYIKFKDFGEDWRNFRQRLPALVPTGYTRIGPAVRHAVHELSETGAKKKLLLLISDGKPTDYDRYEGNYGVQDIRQAIKEANQIGIKIQSLAIDSEAKFYLPQMFGPGGYQILSHPGYLAHALSKVFAECMT